MISRNSATILKGTKKPTREIGELLKVAHVLEGSVRKARNNLRITAQLIDAHPLLEPLRGEPRFQRLLDRIRPEWERFVPRFHTAD